MVSELSPAPIAVENYPDLAETFKVERMISRTDYSEIYEAVIAANGLRVALKIPRESAQAKGVAHVENEVDKQNELRSPYIIPLVNHGVASNGKPYIATQYADKGDLTTLDRDQDGFQSKVVSVMHGVALGLVDIHNQGHVHRDVKPANILLSEDSVFLADLGIADFSLNYREEIGMDCSATTEVDCTPSYTAPELFFGAKATYSADIFAWSITAYKLLSGKLPWERLNSLIPLRPFDVFRIMHSDSPNPLSPLAAPPECRAVIEAGLDLAASNRPIALELVKATV
jgi:serine/threonine protein kinase